MEQKKQLEILTYQLEELRIERNGAFDRDAGPVEVSVDFDLFANENVPNQFAVGLIVQTCAPGESDTSCPLKFLLRMVGVFATAEPLPDGQIPFQHAVNGLMILYGIARGAWGTASAWFGGSVVVLPTVYFTDRLRIKLGIPATEQKAVEASELAITAAD